MDKLKLIEAILGSRCEAETTAFQIGEAVFIRTVTHYLTGRIKAIHGKFLVLQDAAWIADTGRFMQAIQDGKLNEVEPVTVEVRVNSDTIIDCYEWKHALPKGQQ